MPEIICETMEGTKIISLDRPEELNALTPTMLEQLSEVLEEIAADAATKVVVFTGNGRAFCAGADLKFLRDIHESRRDAATSELLRSASEVMTRIERLPKPTIAAVNGLAIAGGLELVLACDLAIAARSARLGDGHANFGLLPGAGGSVRLPRRVGPTQAKYLLFPGDMLAAERCQQIGLVNQVVDDAELHSAAAALAGKLASKSPLGLARMKRLVDDGLDQPSSTAMSLELALGVLHTASFDRNEGIAAFNEKRTPRFEGR